MKVRKGKKSMKTKIVLNNNDLKEAVEIFLQAKGHAVDKSTIIIYQESEGPDYEMDDLVAEAETLQEVTSYR